MWVGVGGRWRERAARRSFREALELRDVSDVGEIRWDAQRLCARLVRGSGSATSAPPRNLIFAKGVFASGSLLNLHSVGITHPKSGIDWNELSRLYSDYGSSELSRISRFV